jgi:hypothetical protein
MKTHQRDTGGKNSQSKDARENGNKIDGFLDSYNNIKLVLLIVIILIIIYINVIK